MANRGYSGNGHGLVVDPAMGMAGDMFSSALIGLGVPTEVITGAMERAGRHLGSATVQARTVPTDEGEGIHLEIALSANDPHLAASDALRYLEACIAEEGLSPAYAELALRTLQLLIAAEREAHTGGQLDVGELTLKAIGVVHTPYSQSAPSQPPRAADGEFYIEVFPGLAAGLEGLDTFSHIYVISYMHRSLGYSLTVTPPWQEGEKLARVGVFASRAPNRPSPLGFTLAQVRHVQGNRITTGPLDLFDGTPLVDIKPHLQTVDETAWGNDGWLADSDHLRLHQEGVPHQHATEEAVLHEAQDILLDVIGAARGLEYLGVSLEDIECLTPVSVGGGEVRFSHGRLTVPAPAVAAILRRHRIPHVTGPEDVELLTPTGAALLAALRPKWRAREMGPERPVSRHGLGVGTKVLKTTNALRLGLTLL